MAADNIHCLLSQLVLWHRGSLEDQPDAGDKVVVHLLVLLHALFEALGGQASEAVDTESLGDGINSDMPLDDFVI